MKYMNRYREISDVFYSLYGSISDISGRIGTYTDLGAISDLNITNRASRGTYHFTFAAGAQNNPFESGDGHGYLYTNYLSSYGIQVAYGDRGMMARKLTNGTYGEWSTIQLDTVTNPVGTVLTGAWTAASSSATLVKLTNSITLTKGVWLVIVTVPVVGEGSSNVTVGPQITVVDNNQFGAAIGAGAQAMRIISVSSTQEVYAISASSAAVTYTNTYFGRGGIRAIKIA